MSTHATPPGSPDHLANLFGAFLTTMGDALTRAVEEAVGIAGSAPAALLTLDTWPDHSIDFLAGVLGITHSGAVRLVDRLKAEGWVERRPGPDGRTTALRLTGRARRRVSSARAERRRVAASFTDALEPGERAVLAAALDRVLRGTVRTRTEARHACRLCDHTVCEGEMCPVGRSADGTDRTA